MNAAHKLGKLRNRLSRCKKKLSDEKLGSDQRSRISQRVSELEVQLK